MLGDLIRVCRTSESLHGTCDNKTTASQSIALVGAEKEEDYGPTLTFVETGNDNSSNEKAA